MEEKSRVLLAMSMRALGTCPCAKVKNKDGEFQYFYGSEEKRPAGQPRSFFLEPYAEIVKLCWSKGRRRETRNLFIERFDCRAQFMSFEFNCRTSDNVELILEGTFFWEVVDLPAMVKSTGDTSGDLCNHARSQFIRHVARVTLKEFMDSSHAIAKKVWEEDTSFYASRGVKIHSLEVTRYQCADSRTSEILEQIIQESWYVMTWRWLPDANWIGWVISVMSVVFTFIHVHPASCVTWNHSYSLQVGPAMCWKKHHFQTSVLKKQETTNRMNRLSQAESENEAGSFASSFAFLWCPLRQVSLFRTHGQIEQERLNGDLLANSLECENTNHQQGCLQNEYAVLKICSVFLFLHIQRLPEAIRHKHSEAEAEVVGRSEANKVAAFIAGLEDKVPGSDPCCPFHPSQSLYSYDYDCTVCYIPHILHSSTHVITNLTCHRSES